MFPNAKAELRAILRDESPPSPPRQPKNLPCDDSLYPSGSRSLTSIGEQAFFMGFLTAFSLLTLYYLTILSPDAPDPIWRLPAFLLCLSVFHYLEYETTARYNLPTLRASSFLLFSNGTAYNVAYALALVEIITTSLFFPEWQARWTNPWTLSLGAALIVMGQVVRSTAMCTAGTNFNHLPATTKKVGHELVTNGVYAYLRHPSYFGFFWWAIGTQLLVGNKVCGAGYVIVLWQFFKHRIVGEEKHLVEFFGVEYERFRERTPTGIPFIR